MKPGVNLFLFSTLPLAGNFKMILKLVMESYKVLWLDHNVFCLHQFYSLAKCDVIFKINLIMTSFDITENMHCCCRSILSRPERGVCRYL